MSFRSKIITAGHTSRAHIGPIATFEPLGYLLKTEFGYLDGSVVAAVLESCPCLTQRASVSHCYPAS